MAPEVLTAAEYFVTVHLGALQPQLVVEYPAPRAVMEDVADGGTHPRTVAGLRRMEEHPLVRMGVVVAKAR